MCDAQDINVRGPSSKGQRPCQSWSLLYLSLALAQGCHIGSVMDKRIKGLGQGAMPVEDSQEEPGWAKEGEWVWTSREGRPWAELHVCGGRMEKGRVGARMGG